MEQRAVFIRHSGEGCSHCHKKVAQMRESLRGNDRVFHYVCPFCHSAWCRQIREYGTLREFLARGIVPDGYDPKGAGAPTGEVEVRRVRRSDLELLEAESSAKCTRCGKAISLLGRFGSWGESEAEGLLIEGAAYCWNCMQKTAEVIEQSARSLKHRDSLKRK